MTHVSQVTAFAAVGTNSTRQGHVCIQQKGKPYLMWQLPYKVVRHGKQPLSNQKRLDVTHSSVRSSGVDSRMH